MSSSRSPFPVGARPPLRRAAAGPGLSRPSLPAVTLPLAAMDAFSPCAFFVLLFLLGLQTHEHPGGRMPVAGGVPGLFFGPVYFGLMAARLDVSLFAGEPRLVTLAG